MDRNTDGDQFVLIKIEGMHCHKCEQAIQKALQKNAGVHEVEVDFASGQASILFDRAAVGVGQLMETVRLAGYKPTSFTQGQLDSTPHS
jgi:copper chaperone CopZ